MAVPLPSSIPTRLTRWIPHTPTPPQRAFLGLTELEALYGGAAGGGKSDALLMAALQYADVPGYSALLLRRTYAELRMQGALLQRSHEWLGGTDAAWNGEEHTWTFPSGAVLAFGHAEYETSVYRYQSAEFQYIGVDQLESFLEVQYRFLFSRLRRATSSAVPIRMRSAANPGAAWVRDRFIPIDTPGGGREYPANPENGELRVFIPARLHDNPYIDAETYLRSLSELDPVTRQRLVDGDWNVIPAGGFFRRDRIPIIDELEPNVKYSRAVRRWDLAATPKTATNDPDWTAGAKIVREISRNGQLILDDRRRPGGRWVLTDLTRTRAAPFDVERLIEQTAELDGRETEIWIEEEPGSSGKSVVAHYQRLLRGYRVRGQRVTGSKEVRAGPFASQADAGMVVLVRGYWNGPFLEEAERFGAGGAHDDMVDAAVGAWEAMEHLASGATFSR